MKNLAKPSAVLIILILFTMKAFCQMVINTSATPEQLVQTLVGNGVTFSNVTYGGGNVSRGTFSGPNNIGIPSGVVLATGNANSIPQYPTNGMDNSGTSAVQNDPDMNSICGVATQNGSILEFDFVPQGDLLTFNFIFASEEYANFAPPCASSYNDGFGFFISGPGISGPYSNNSANIALIPSTTIPVSINNINCITNTEYYKSNYNGNGQCNGCPEGLVTDPNFVFNAYSAVLQATVVLIPCSTYHIKLAVANAADGQYQSGVLLEESSFSSIPINISTVYSVPSLDTTTVEGCNYASVTFGLDEIGIVNDTIPLSYGGTATYGVDYNSLPEYIVVPAGSQNASVNIVPVDDGITEGTETIEISYSNVTCSGIQTQTVTYNINDYPPLAAFVSPDDTTVMCNQVINLAASPGGGIVPYHYAWNTGDTTASITVNPLITTVYNVQISDGCSSSVSGSAVVNVLTPAVSAGPDDTTCYAQPYSFTGNAMNYLAGSEQWTHFGTGTLSGAASLTPTYTPGAGESGLVKFRFTVAGTGGCAGQLYSDSTYLLIEPVPVALAGNDAAICQSQTFTLSGQAFSYDPSSVAWTENGAGSLSGNNTLSPVYSPASGESGDVMLILNMMGTGTCSTQQASDTLILTVNPLPSVYAGMDNPICEGNTITLTDASALHCDGVAWTSRGDGTFNNSASLNPTYTPGAGDVALGSVVLILTGNGDLACDFEQAVDSVEIIINPQPFSDAGPGGIICQGNSFTVNGAVASDFSGYSWTENGTGSLSGVNTLTPMYTPGPGETGPVTLTFTVQGILSCSSSSDVSTAILDITPYPVADAGQDGQVCQNATFTVSTAASQYDSTHYWTHNGAGMLTGATTLTPSYTPGPGETGPVTLTLHSLAFHPCDDVTDAMTLTINPVAVANAGPDDKICEGSTYLIPGSSASG
ncbi:MAG TPA: choice-of-anchor L domain-containing protein, partial [Bacteroidales bacterium]|nr:choice-of-anchor L domain-containing protein [Bacteroidales bacterium]